MELGSAIGEDQVKEAKSKQWSEDEKLRSEEFIKLSNVRDFTKMAISQATFGVRRPTSTTFVDIFKGYNAEVYMKIKFQEEAGQKGETVRRWRKYRADEVPDNFISSR